MSVRLTIFVAGVTFEDGTRTKTLLPEDFDEDGRCVVRFVKARFRPPRRRYVVERSYDRFGRLVGLSVDGERRAKIAYDGETGCCVASCEIARACGPSVAWTLGILKEVRDVLFGIPQGVAAGFDETNLEMALDLILNGDGLTESINDLKADSLGIDAGNGNGDCKCACQKHYEP